MAASHSGTFTEIDAALSYAVNDGTVLGVYAVAATNKGVIDLSGFGTANVEIGAPMKDNFVFWLCSREGDYRGDFHSDGAFR